MTQQQATLQTVITLAEQNRVKDLENLLDLQTTDVIPFSLSPLFFLSFFKSNQNSFDQF